MTEAVSGGDVAAVALILHMGDGVGGGVVRQGLRRQRQEGPQQPGRVGTSAQRPGLPHPPEPCRTRAPDEVQEHGLGVVPGVVGGKNSVKAAVFRRFLQKIIPQYPGSLLNGPPLPRRQGAGVSGAGDESDAPVRAEASDKGLVPVGGPAPQLVVEVGGGDGKALLAA